MGDLFYCNECEWKGRENELEYDNIESCMGDDKVEVCPSCGSMNINRIKT